MRRLVMVIAAPAFLAACGGVSERTGGGGGQSAPVVEDVERSAGASGGAASGGATAGLLEAPAVEPTVIKTADLDVRVRRDGFADAMAAATNLAARHGGFVLSSSRAGDDARRGTVTIRVPSERFEVALRDLRALGEVRREHVRGEDVGQEFVDLEARLRNLHAQEAVLLRLFDEATSVVDTIRVQRELSGVQLEVERIEGRLRYLRDQTALATITVSLSEEGADAPGALAAAWHRAGRGFVAVAAGLVTALGYAVPLGLLAGIVLAAVRRFGRRPARTQA